MFNNKTITSVDGVALNFRSFGNPAGQPILLVHGFAQSLWCWQKQFSAPELQSFHLVAFDMRGHGQSDKPDVPAAYQSSDVWADDVAAVIDGLGLENPLAVFWSYSGLVLCDYLRRYGDGALSGMNFVSARTKVGTPAAKEMSGTLFSDLVPGFCSADAVQREAAVRLFLENLTEGDIPNPDFYTMLGYNLAVPPHVCAAMLDRQVDNDDVLQRSTVPTLITHGNCDTSVLPLMAQHHERIMPQAELALWSNIGHAPFYEDADRFNTELARFAIQCFRSEA
ncbi:MAG: alpha/beta fold hydrolase [Alphaproteobacteria bacterium]